MRIDRTAFVIGLIVVMTVAIVAVIYNRKTNKVLLTSEEPDCVKCLSISDQVQMCDCFDNNECPQSYEKYNCASVYPVIINKN